MSETLEATCGLKIIKLQSKEAYFDLLNKNARKKT